MNLQSTVLLALCALVFAPAWSEEPAKPAEEAAPAFDALAFQKLTERGDRRGAVEKAIAELQRRQRAKLSGGAAWDEKLFEGACAFAEDAQMPALKEILLHYPDDLDDLNTAFTTYALARFQHFARTLKAGGTKIVLPPLAQEVPPEFAADPDLKSAWLAWHRAVDPYWALRAAATAPEHLEKVVSRGSLNDAMLYSLEHPGVPGAEAIWSDYDKDQKKAHTGPHVHLRGSVVKAAVLLSLLDGNEPAALGAALLQESPREMGPSITSDVPYRESLQACLAAAGLDWEEVFAGALLPEEPGRTEPAPVYLQDDHDGLNFLATHGTAHGVRLGLAAIRQAKLKESEALPFLFSALGVERKFEPARHQEPVTGDVRREALAQLGGFLDPARPEADLISRLRDWPSAAVVELRPVFEKLLPHSSYVIAAKARMLMKDAGLNIDHLPVTSGPRPLRIHILANGAPMAKTEFSVEFDHVVRPKANSDADGWVSLPLDDELELEATAKVRLHTGHEGKVEDGHYRQPWLDFEVDVKGATHREHTVELSTASLEIDLDVAGQGALAKPGTLGLSNSGDRFAHSWDHRIKVPITDSVTFDCLQRQTYRAWVDAEGMVTYVAKPIELAKNGSIRLFSIEHGHEVRVKILLAGKKKPIALSDIVLSRDGKPFDNLVGPDAAGWSRFPTGKFRMELELAAKLPDGLEIGDLEPWEYEFEIREDSPSVIDLGTLEIREMK